MLTGNPVIADRSADVIERARWINLVERLARMRIAVAETGEIQAHHHVAHGGPASRQLNIHAIGADVMSRPAVQHDNTVTGRTARGRSTGAFGHDPEYGSFGINKDRTLNQIDTTDIPNKHAGVSRQSRCDWRRLRRQRTMFEFAQPLRHGLGHGNRHDGGVWRRHHVGKSWERLVPDVRSGRCQSRGPLLCRGQIVAVNDQNRRGCRAIQLGQINGLEAFEGGIGQSEASHVESTV